MRGILRRMQLRPEFTATEALTQKMEFQLLLAQHAELQLQYETAASYLESLLISVQKQKTDYQVKHSQEAADCFRMSERIEQLLQEAGLSTIKSHFAAIEIRIKIHNQHYTVCKEEQHLFKSSKAIKKDIRSVRKAVTNVSSYSAALDLMCGRIEHTLSSLEFIPEPIQQSTLIAKDVVTAILALEEQIGLLKSTQQNDPILKQLDKLMESLPEQKQQILLLQQQIQWTAAAVNEYLARYQILLHEQFSNLLVKLKLLRKDIALVVENFISLPHTIL